MRGFRRAAPAVMLSAVLCVLGSGPVVAVASAAPARAAVSSGTSAGAAPPAHSGADAVVAARLASSNSAVTSLHPRPPTGVQARGAELVDQSTGRLLWSRGRNVRRPMASITKVMTALVVIRAGRLGRRIKITQRIVRYVRRHDGSSAGLHAGDILTAHQLLEGMLIPSGCDAAFALAVSYGPGWKAFVRKMNATARQLGLRSTQFANFDGLPWPTEHTTNSTPRDLVRLGEAAMKLRIFRAIVRRRSYFIEATRLHHRYRWKTTNLLLGHYRGLIGIKTGTTNAAGYCLLFEALRGRTTLIGVVLDSSMTNLNAPFTDTTRLLNWGFRVTSRHRDSAGSSS